MPEWLEDASANRHIKTYVKDFLDLSGNLTIRQKNDEYGWSVYGQMMLGKYETNNTFGYFGNGSTMDASGTTIAIGANQEGNSNATDGGNVYVMKYDVSAGIWYQIGQTLTGGTNYGYKLSLSHDGTRLLVGDYNYNSVGAVFAYDYNSSTDTWTQVGGTNDMVNPNSFRVHSASLSGDGTTALISGIAGNPDRIRIYRYDGSSTWVLIGDLYNSTVSGLADNKGFGYFGTKLSYDGNRIITNEHGWDNNSTGEWVTDIGRAFVFDYSGSGTSWSLVGDIIYPPADDNVANIETDQFGITTDMTPDGMTIAVAARYGASSLYYAHNPGYVAVYRYDATVSGSWKQLGANIYGQQKEEEFGYLSIALSHDGYTLIAGGRENDYSGNDSGYIQKFVYDQSNNAWLEEGKPVYSSYKSGLMQNIVCNYDANIVFVNHVVANVNDYNQGVVEIYKWGTIENTGTYLDISGGEFSIVEGKAQTNALKYSSTQLGQIIYGEQSRDYLGTSVTMSGNGMVMASGTINYQQIGYVKVFKYNKNSDNDGLWHQHIQIYGNTTNTIDYFGGSVKLSRNGNVLAVGGGSGFYGYTSSTTDGRDGFVRVFKEVDNVWTQIGSDIADISQGDGTGGKATLSLNSDGTILAVGSFKADSGNGAVRVFEYNSGSNSWSQLGSTLYGDDISSHDYFGVSVDLNDDGTMLAVGAPINIGSADNVSTDTKAGYAKVFKYANGSWSTYGTNSDGDSRLQAGTRGDFAGVTLGDYSDCCGICVSFDADGTTLAVGARFAQANSGIQYGMGVMTVFKYSSEGNKWMNYGKPIFPDAEEDNQAADSVSLSSDGKTMVIGSRMTRDGGGTDSRGDSQVYKFIEGDWHLIAGPFYGIQGNGPNVTSVSMSSDGTRFVHGMMFNATTGNTAGAIQAFQIDYERATLKIKDGVIHAPTGVGAPDGDLVAYLPYLTGLAPSAANYEQIWGNNIGSGTYDPDAATPYNHAYLYIKNAVREADDLLLTGTLYGYELTSKRAAAGTGSIYLSCEYGTRTSMGLGIGGNVSESYLLQVYTTIYVSGSRTTSDDRVKHNEEPIINALETIRKLTPKHYIKTYTMYDANHDFVLDASGNPLDASGNLLKEDYFREDGLIAQEIELIPELKHVVNDECIKDDIKQAKTVNYNSIFVRAVKALQELDAIDQQQQAKIESLEARIEALENK